MANFEHAEDEAKHVNMSGEVSASRPPNKSDQVSHAPSGVPGSAPSAIPSFAAASELLSAPYSCLVLNTHRRHIALAPLYLNKKKSGIQEELDAELLKFSQRLNGVPLAYDSIRIVGQQGDIYDDSGYVHMDIEANFIVFQPGKGQKLLGKVNKLGVSHVGCLVHGCFNASIPKPNLVSMETWRDAGPRIGTELEFKVMALDADIAGVLLIRGQLDRTKVQELMAVSESSESSVPPNQSEPQEPEPQEAEPTAEPTQESPDDTPRKKKKKKKKDHIKEEETEEEIRNPPNQLLDFSAASELNGTMDEMNGGRKKKKKKKNKEIDLKEEEVEMEIPLLENFGNPFNDKPSKKRKHESEDHTPTKSKKKRKGDIEQFTLKKEKEKKY